MSTAQDPAFHLFPNLPTELRLLIWRFCLPNRVIELDHPHPDPIFDFKRPAPCTLAKTTVLNNRPPLIAGVCHEARTVASESSLSINLSTQPDSSCNESHPSTGQGHDINGEAEEDIPIHLNPHHDVVHLHHEPVYESDQSAGNPLRHIISIATQTTPNQASLSLGLLLVGRTQDWPQLPFLLSQRPWWLVVIHVVPIHMSLHAGSLTGLFGLLGDAPVQIVDLRDKHRLGAYYDLAAVTQHRRGDGELTVEDEKLVMMVDVETKRCRSESAVRWIYKLAAEPAPAMYPAIMFRLCPEECDRLGE
ncbi:uncharacterized protein F4822DRAFT_114563 [Hypoxylon trugodes]|uniref:uncharacterized protein n=1 Tax=Hypoxylon trugodes TaxID=326681 RepID=UPI002194007A|nr:uncharacterized protein F4822DRAFT_114563 [Hypoxylon trugodes]KAI1392058.1 hypothetical protein F4822DRAFT_114563 [Hypoxylon trugodes]